MPQSIAAAATKTTEAPPWCQLTLLPVPPSVRLIEGRASITREGRYSTPITAIARQSTAKRSACGLPKAAWTLVSSSRCRTARYSPNLLKSGLRFSAKAAAPSLPSALRTNRSRPAVAILARPAWCSVSVLKACLRNLIAVGLI